MSACSAHTSSVSADENSGTVNFLIENSPTNLDPRIGTDAWSQHIDDLLFSSLVARDAQMNPTPDLAESWDTPDPLTYIFHLRRNVTFSNGAPLTSADVLFTLNSILTGPLKTPKRAAFRMVDSITAPDPYTVQIHLREPYASFLWNLSRPAIGIVPRNSTAADIARAPIGSGPFRFVSATPDFDILLERNPKYFGPAPHIARVHFRIVPDATVRALELRKGSADIELGSLTPDMVDALRRYPHISAEDQPGTSLAYIAFNFEDPILAKREVRQALAYATDRAAIVRYLLRGQARLASSLLPPAHWAFDANLPDYNYDPARAAALFDSAGFTCGAGGIRFRLTLKTSTDESTRLYSEVIQQQWKKLGVALEIRPQEFATFYSDITHGSFQLYTQRWVGGNNDPDIFEFVFSSHKIPPDGANRGRYRNPQLDTLLDESRQTPDHDKRRQILQQVQQIVADDLPYINLWYVDNVSVHRDTLLLPPLNPSGDYQFLTSLQFRTATQ
jgi:peptide/nickel transport system substrate-binding protein